MTPVQSYREIPLTQGQVAIVDAADFEWLSQWKWHAIWSENTGTFYARRKEGPTTFSMHRQILGLIAGDPRKGDHINFDTLDNRRHNIRIATCAQNQMNQRKRRDNTSGYRGVSPNGYGKWVAFIGWKGKHKYLGTFPTRESAYAAYCSAAEVCHGEFSSSNNDSRTPGVPHGKTGSRRSL